MPDLTHWTPESEVPPPLAPKPPNVTMLDDHRPHAAWMTCCGCGNGWVAVAPLGCVALECPSCGRMAPINGQPIGMAEPMDPPPLAQPPMGESRGGSGLGSGVGLPPPPRVPELADTERPPPCHGCPAVESLRVSLGELADVARETRGMVQGLADDLREERKARRSERADLTQRVHALEVAQTEHPESLATGKPGKGGALAAALAAIATAAAGVAAALSQ